MENLTESDILEYLNRHKKELKNREALFVGYIKTPYKTTFEEKMLLLKKNGILFWNEEAFKSACYKLNRYYDNSYTFDSMLENISKSKISTNIVTYILIPYLKCLDIDYFNIMDLIRLCLAIEDNITNIKSQDEEIIKINKELVLDTVDNYSIANLIVRNKLDPNYYEINMSKDDAKSMLTYYTDLFGKEKMAKIKMGLIKYNMLIACISDESNERKGKESNYVYV